MRSSRSCLDEMVSPDASKKWRMDGSLADKNSSSNCSSLVSTNCWHLAINPSNVALITLSASPHARCLGTIQRSGATFQ